ncbi:MAG: hypothetical protein AAF481_10610 [Acidobacteriota bacterium]
MVEVSVAEDPTLLEPFRDRLSKLQRFDHYQRIGIARQAVAENPQSAAAVRLLLRELEAGDEEDEMALVLRDAMKRGLPGMREALRVRAPSLLPRDELAEWEGSGNMSVLAALAEGFIAEGNIERCRTALHRFLSTAMSSNRATDEWTERFLRIVLLLQGSGHLEEGVRQLHAFACALETLGLSTRDLDDSRTLPKWTIARELARQPESFPRKFLTTAARSTANGSLGDARERLRQLAGQHPILARRARNHLRSSDLLAGILDRKEPSPTKESWTGCVWPLFLLIVVVTLVSTGLPEGPSQTETASAALKRVIERTHVRNLEPEPPKKRIDAPEYRRVRRSPELVVEERNRIMIQCAAASDSPVCRFARPFFERIDQGDCTGAVERWESLGNAAYEEAIRRRFVIFLNPCPNEERP